MTSLRNILERALDVTGTLDAARLFYRTLSPDHRRRSRAFVRQIEAILPGSGISYAHTLACFPQTRSALLVGYADPQLAALQFPLIAALRVCSYRVIVRLYVRWPAIEMFYRRLGAQEFVFQEDHSPPGVHPDTEQLVDELAIWDDLLDLRYHNLSVGKFAASTLLRQLRIGQLDFGDPVVLKALRAALSDSLKAADAAIQMIERLRPDLVCFVDRGYTPEAQLFEAALATGSGATTMNAAHRSGLLMLKRYGMDNRDRHPASLDADSWTRLRTMTWTPAHWHALRSELANSYRTGAWYDEVGTQFGKVENSPQEIAKMLGLNPARKTAILFAHMFWDATFFWGEDLFAGYEDWFCECLKAAAANDRLNWIIKIHPANVVKDSRDGYQGEHSEVRAIRDTLGRLPEHIALLEADSPISTFSLFQLMDYCLTVRGTVGIEAACFGVPVLTAGTGRYDRLGFTIDHDSREAYYANLARLEQVPRLTEPETELARRFAYGVIMARPLALQSTRFEYDHDSGARLKAKVVLDATAEVLRARDIAAIASWLESGKEDLLNEEALDPAGSAFDRHDVAVRS